MKEMFLRPGTYIKFWDETDRKFKYYLLTAREAPIKYPYTFSSLAANTKGSVKNFEDLNPSKNHIYQAFLGIRDGLRAYVWLPYDKKVLKLDNATLDDISEDSVALEQGDSPYEDPVFDFWFTRDKYPGLQVKNLTNKTIYPQVIFVCAKYTYEEITKENNAELYDKLERNIVPSKPVLTGAIA